MCKFDATIFCERVPEIEYRDGLFHVTDRVGGVVMRRVYLPSAFLAALGSAVDLARQFDRERREGAVRLHAAASIG